MASIDDKIKDLLKNEKATAILEDFRPGIAKDPKVKLIGGKALRSVLEQALHGGKITQEQLDGIDAKLKAID